MSPRARRRCLQGLAKVCGEYDILPDSYIIPESKVQKLGDSPISSNRFSDIWPGMYDEAEDEKDEDERDEDERKSVAIKVMRYWESDDVRAMRKVRCFDLSLSHDRAWT
jgi:hypothetical protein